MPIEISDWNDLDNVRNDLTADYVLVNDLDSDTTGYTGIGDDFEPIGVRDADGDAFAGTFDGDGFAIEDLIVDIDPTEGGVGLFGGTNNSGVVVVENLSVSGSVTNADTSFNETGGLVGRHDGGTIQNCVGHVDVTHQGSYAGGLVGYNTDTVTDSYATGSVEGDEQVGGLVGFNNGGTVTDSYATGSVEGDERVGGLVGRNNATIQTSYAVGLVTGNTDVGGLCSDPFNNGTVTDSYWDTEATGQSTSDGGTGLTTVEMQGSEAETNMDFDFANVWETVEEEDVDAPEDGYPILLALDRDSQIQAQIDGGYISAIFTAFVQVNGVSKAVTDAFVQINGQAVDASTAFTQVNDDVREI